MPCSKTCGLDRTVNRPDFTPNTASRDSVPNHCQPVSPLKIVNRTAITPLVYNPNSSLTQSIFALAYAELMVFKKWSFYGHAH